MYILNPDSLKNKKSFSKKISDYLENHGVPLLAVDGGKYYYADTDLLKNALENAPLWVKFSMLVLHER